MSSKWENIFVLYFRYLKLLKMCPRKWSQFVVMRYDFPKSGEKKKLNHKIMRTVKFVDMYFVLSGVG